MVHRVQAARDQRYASLRGFFHGASDVEDDAESLQLRLHSVTLHSGAAAVGKTLEALDLASLDAEVTGVRRGKLRLDVAPDTTLLAGDVVVLRGSGEGVARAEARLLK